MVNMIINLRASVYVLEMSHDGYYRYIDLFVRGYNNAGFFIKTIHCGGKYKAILDRVKYDLKITLECVSHGEMYLRQK